MRASSRGKLSQSANTGAVANWLINSQAAPSGNGNSQGNTQAATISSTLPRPEPLK